MESSFTYTVMILSAGESRRMGCFPKALLDSGDGALFLERILNNVQSLEPPPQEIIVVLGYHREKIEERIDLSGCKVVVNPDPGRGMLSSIIEGIASFYQPDVKGTSEEDTPGVIERSAKNDEDAPEKTFQKYPVSGMLMALVDHPLVKKETYQKVLKTASEYPGDIIIPINGVRKGHPVYFPSWLFDELMAAPVDGGARAVVRKHNDKVWNVLVEDDNIYTDIDTPELYRRFTNKEAPQQSGEECIPVEDASTITGMLHHVEIYVSDLKKSIEFWGWFLEKLGYYTYSTWESGISLKKGDTYLVFVQAEEKHLDVPYHRCRVGLNHLAFHAASRQMVDEMTQELQDRGVTILYEDRHPFAGGPDYYAVFFEDPDRIKVELVAPE